MSRLLNEVDQAVDITGKIMALVCTLVLYILLVVPNEEFEQVVDQWSKAKRRLTTTDDKERSEW